MFAILFLIFIVFTLVYGLFSAAILYHLNQYAVPGNTQSRVVISSFIFLSLLFWFFAIYFLVEIRMAT